MFSNNNNKKLDSNEADIENQDSSGIQIDIDAPDSNQPLVAANSSELGLDRIYNHYIKECDGNPIRFSAGNILGFFLEALGGTGGIYAWPPAWEYAKSNNLAPWLSYSFAITNPISNVLFLIKATDDLFDIIQSELRPPKEIKDLITVPTKKELATKYLKMILGSVICAIPFGVSVYLFPLPGCDQTACLSVTIADSIATNTILHAVSWNLILSPEYWYFRLPIIPFEKLYSRLSNCRDSKEKIEMVKLSGEQEKIYSKYKNILASAFASRAEEIVKHYLTKTASASEVLRSIQKEDMNLIKFSELARKHTPVPKQTQQPSFFRQLANKTDSFLSNHVVGIAGSGILMAGCIGWITNSFYVSSLAGLDIPESFFTGILPS